MNTNTKFGMMFVKEAAGMKSYAFHEDQQDELKIGQYIKFNHGIAPYYISRMMGKIVKIGFSEKYQCKYFDTITDCGFFTTTAENIYKVYRPKIKEKIKAMKNASCIALNTNHSEELPFMIGTLDKIKNYITRKNIGNIEACDITDTNRTYNYNLTVSYPKSGNVVTYFIPNRTAKNISFILKGKKKPYTFKIRNRKGKIELNFEKVKRIIKRFI